MSKINENSSVTMTYEGKLDNGDIFKTITKENPLKIKIGDSEIPPTLEQALMDMSAGETKTVRLSPEEGYGARQKILLQTLNKEFFGEKITPKLGMILSLKVNKEGEEHQVPATITEISNDSVVVDYNHPLAGHHLTYHISILKVENS